MNKVVGNIKRNLPSVTAPKVLLIAACLVCMPLLSGAQNDVSLSANDEALKSEFQQEMDKWGLKAYEGDRDAPVILCLHGQATWSYLYRNVIPILVDAGYRAVAAASLGARRSCWVAARPRRLPLC